MLDGCGIILNGLDLRSLTCFLVDILLKTGRHHQIRVQFASRGYPLYGDQRYGKMDKKQLALFCYKLEFFSTQTFLFILPFYKLVRTV